jgi:DNA-directed RNA polymerase specialized sigma24 family protein
MNPAYALTTSPAPTATTAEAWLQWFATEKQATCRAYVCTRYHLNGLDAEALINTALLQIVGHWPTIDNPLAFFWQTLRHAVAKQGQHRVYARQQLTAYAQQHRLQAHHAARTAQHVADILARVSPRQRCLLTWYAQGFSDAEVAGWLTTTPQAVRVARHAAYRALRTQLCPSAHLSRRGHTAATRKAKNVLGTTNIVPSSRPL